MTFSAGSKVRGWHHSHRCKVIRDDEDENGADQACSFFLTRTLSKSENFRASVSSGSVVSCFIKLSKLLNQEVAWAHPACTVISAPRGGTGIMCYPLLRLWLYRLSPLFHQGAQVSELINLSILPLSVITLLFTAPSSSCTNDDDSRW
jgi:hypothetical protein